MTNLSVYLASDAAIGAFAGSSVSFDARGAHVHVHANATERLRKIQMAARKLGGLGAAGVELAATELSGPWDEAAQWAFFQGYATAKKPDAVALAPALDARKRCALWLKQITNATPEDLSPQALAEASLHLLREFGGARVSATTLAGDALAAAGYVGLHGVGRGSVRGAVLLSLDFNPSGDPTAPVAAALVGKGITFDSGGYSIKESAGMVTMKHDMGGAATVTAALALAIAGGLNKRVKMFLCCAENLISGHAYKLGDILRYRNGVSVEVVNTDAEGRLVLADGLLDAAATGAPWIFDAATLTGAAVVATGGDYNAVFSTSQQASAQYLQWAEAQDELHWPLPLAAFHKTKCPSPYADTANSRAVKGGGPGGASNAAGFLSRFVPEDRQWIHLDLAASFAESDGPMFAAGATAMGMRTLAHALLQV
jgi:PepB aminopeptidase